MKCLIALTCVLSALVATVPAARSQTAVPAVAQAWIDA